MNNDLRNGELGALVCAGLIVIALMYWIATVA